MTHDTNIPHGYKATALGIIPQEWEVRPLNYLGAICSGGTPDTEVAEYWNGDIAWCTPSDITKLDTKYIESTEVKITAKGLKESSATLLPPRSIVVCTRATIGSAAICNTEIATNQGFKNIIPNEKANPEWLYYIIIYSKPRLVRIGCGSTFLEVSKKDFSRFKIVVPPLAEQRKIAEVLGVWDEAIEKQARLIEKLALRKRALMQRLLSAKLRLPGFSEPWEKVKLGDIGHFLSSNTLSRDCLNEQIGNIKNIHYGDILIKLPTIVDASFIHIPYVNDDVIVKSDYLKNGDIIFADTAEDYTVGKAIEIINIQAIPVTSGLHTIPFRPKSGIFVNRFLGYYVNSTDYRRQLQPLIQGIKVYSISKTALCKTTLKIPTLSEQTAIAEVLTAADREIELAKEKLERLRRQKRGLMQQLLSGKKRVKINI